jgi:PKD repeat protein
VPSRRGQQPAGLRRNRRWSSHRCASPPRGTTARRLIPAASSQVSGPRPAPDFNLALGDLSYGATGTESTWCDLVKSKVGSDLPFELITGNHESDGLNGLIDNFAACLPNKLPGLVGTYGKEWYVDVPAAAPIMRIVMISPNMKFPGSNKWAYTVGSSHYNWTAAAIDGAHTANIPWVVVGMHEPCLTLTAANCSSGPDLMNLLVSKKVDLVLEAHVHMYERTKQLSYSASCPVVVPNTSSAACIADSDSTMTQGGTVFATVGTGGEVEQHPTLTDPEAPYFAAWNGVHTSAWGFLDVTADSGHLTASFDTTSGTTLSDTFTISRPDGPPANVPPVAAFSSACTELVCTFDGSGSSDSDGSISSYAWNFGDGSTDTSASPPHTFAAAATYTVSLTVTDNDGATNTVSHQVTVTSGGGGGTVAFIGGGHAAGGAVKVEQVAVPATAQVGDTMVLLFTSTLAWTGPSGITGWTSTGTFTNGSSTSSVWVKSMAAGDVGKSVRMDNANYTKAVLNLAVYSGVDPTQIAVAHTGDAAKSAHPGAVVTAPAGAWVLSYWADKSASTTAWIAPTGVTTRDTAFGSGTGHYSSLLADTNAPVAVGTYGPLTATANSTSTNAEAWSITLPAAA